MDTRLWIRWTKAPKSVDRGCPRVVAEVESSPTISNALAVIRTDPRVEATPALADVVGDVPPVLLLLLLPLLLPLVAVVVGVTALTLIPRIWPFAL